MASPAAVLNILITANSTQAQAELAKTQGQLKSTQRTALGAGSAFNKAFGKAAATGTLIAFGAVVAQSVKKSAEFERQMTLVSTQAGATRAEVARLSKQVLDFAKSGSEYGPIELAKALYRIESAGIRGAKAMQTLKASVALAETGQADLEQTTFALVSAMNTGIKGSGTLGKTIGSLNAIIGQGSMRMDDLTAAMGTGFLSNARQMGLNLNQAGAALAALTKQGQPATQSATRLSMAFRMLMAPTDKAQKALKSIGLSAGQLGTMMQAGKFPQAIHLLVQRLNALGDSPEALQKKAQIIRELFGARSATGINAIIQGLKQYDTTLKNTTKTASNFEQKHKEQQNTLDAQWKQLKSRVEAFEVEIGDRARPIITAALKQINQGMQGKGIAGAAFRIGAGAVKSLFNQLTRFPSAGASVLKAFVDMGHGGNIFHKALNGVNEVAKKVIGIDFGAVPRKIKDAWGGLKNILTHPFKSALDLITGFINDIIGVINTVLGPVGVHIGQVGGGGGGKNVHIPGGTKKNAAARHQGRLQMGGLAGVVPGSGVGDKVLMQAMVEPNEGVFIMNRNAMGALQAVNNSVPRFKGGGGMAGSMAQGARTGFRSVQGFHLPGVGSLPQWIQPAGTFVLDKVTDFIEKKLTSLFSGAGVGGQNVAGLQAGIRNVMAVVLAHTKGLSLSSGFRPGPPYHGTGRAVDLSGSPSDMLAAAAWIDKNLGPALTEGIHNPNLSIKNGQRVAPGFWGASTWAGHLNHIHLAKQRGGQIFGSRLGRDQLTTLASYAGMRNPSLMAAIAMAESGGNPLARGAAGEYGLWQIMPFWGGGRSLLDPIKNARKAKYILGKQGLGAWTTYRSGAYKRFLGGHVKAGLMNRLRGGTTGKTRAGTRSPKAPQPYGTEGYDAVVAAIDARNEILGTVNDLIGQGNLASLQRYQTGLAQNPLLGIPSPGAPNLTPYRPSMAYPPTPSGTASGPYSGGISFGLTAHPPPEVHNHIYIDGKEIRGVTKVEMRKAARKGRRRLPSGRR